MTIANVDQAAAWDGPDGANWAEYADRYDTAISRIWSRFLEKNLVRQNDKVLDIGCGNGKSSRDIARVASAGSVFGIDLSGRMLEVASQRSASEGLRNVSFLQADAQVHPFEHGAFDFALSRFGAMFFADPVAAFSNICAALRPGGRLALVAWGELADNEWLLAFRKALAVGRTLPVPPIGAPGQFGLANPDHVRRILGDSGFTKANFELVTEPIGFGADAQDAFSFIRTQGFVRGLTQDLDDASKAQALDALHRTLVDHQTDGGVFLQTSSWIITAQRP
ncbi:MAG: methyltransferase domain-containing protein [Ilumatobacteraceae bacterium]